MVRLFAVLLAGFVVMSAPLSAAEESLSDPQAEEVRKLVRETLMKNPEIIIEAMEAYQARMEEETQARQKQQLSALEDLLYNAAESPVIGNPKGDVELIEFFDYQCGYCKRVYKDMMEAVNADGNVKVIMKEFAILGPVSEIAARVALAAEQQGKYEIIHDALMTSKGRLSEDKVFALAQELGLDMEKLRTDMQGESVSTEINRNRQIAQMLGITGTPAFIIGDNVIPGAVPAEALSEAIKAQRYAQQTKE